jgi:hypothetical protein
MSRLASFPRSEQEAERQVFDSVVVRTSCALCPATFDGPLRDGRTWFARHRSHDHSPRQRVKLLRTSLADPGDGARAVECSDGAPSGSWSPNLLRYRRLNQAIEREE